MFIMLYGAVAQPAKNSPVSAMNNTTMGSVDLIIQTDGSTQTLVNQIMREGGTIHYAYQNLPVIAAAIPAESLMDVYQHPNVIKVSKDHLVMPLDSTTDGDPARDLPAYPLDASGFHVHSIDPTSLKPGDVPLGYGGFQLSGAYDIWEQAQHGSGSVVAVVDTGTVPNPCLGESVIGLEGFAEGYNATGDGIPATHPDNLRHGTHIAGVIASACLLDFSDDPSEPLNQAVAKYFDWEDDIVYVIGQAPAAQIYPVKVFDTTGEGSPTSVILDGLDHLLTLKKRGDLDIDVVNLSFGGPTGYDGRDMLDSFLEQFRELGMLVVAAAGNNGPLPNSLASPGTSYDSITVGALDYAPASRVVYEYLGLTTPGLGPGQGEVMRPTDELRVADFSSRGPMSDGRFGPDLVAPGMWSFQYAVKGGFEWYSGTSYAAAAVSGAAALLNAYYEAENQDDTPWLLWRNSLLLGTDLSVIGEPWRDLNTAGYGALDAAAALEILKSGAAHLEHQGRSEQLRSNILGNPMSADIQTFVSELVTLPPSQSLDYLVDISSSTSNVNIQISEVSTLDNSAYAYWPNSLKILVQSAKRSASTLPVYIYWEPKSGDSQFTIEIEDGTWFLDGVPLVNQPMEPGLMKISLIADYANESPVSFKVHLTRQEDPQRGVQKPYSQGILNMGDVIQVPVEIPEGTGRAVFDLIWNRDWQKFPTSDIDLLVFDPQGNPASSAGATWNAPERVVISDPAPGTWWLQIEGREMYKTDLYRLYVQMETNPQFDIISQHPASDSSTGTGDDSASTHIIWLPIIP
jgi:serine protease AprX